MALYWHPFLAEMLRLSYADRLIVQEQVSLGDMPLQADLLLIRRDPAVPLPFPLEFLGRRTLVEFKSPEDTADQAALEQLEIYGMLYVRREGLRQRRDLTLWLMASQIAGNVSQPGRAELVGLREVGPGVWHGMLDGFPTYLVDLRRVPFSRDTIPLHMVASGPQERPLVEYILNHHGQYPRQLDLLWSLHLLTLTETMLMRNQTPERLGLNIDLDDLETLCNRFGKERIFTFLGLERVLKTARPEQLARLLGPEQLVRLLGPEKVIEILGPEQLARLLGPEKVIEILGPEQLARLLGPEKVAEALGDEALLDVLIKRYGAEKVQELLQRKRPPASPPDPSAPSQN